MKVRDSIEKLHWNESDDFEGEFNTKKTKEELTQQAVINDMAQLALTDKNTGFNESYWINLVKNQDNKDIPNMVKKYTKEYKKI